MSDLIKKFDFEGKTIRTTIIDGVAWFVAKDVCDYLELKDARQSVEALLPAEKLDGKFYVQGQNRRVWLINDSGLRAMVLKSNKPKAVEFRYWITSKVIPSIEKHGMYATDSAVENFLNNPDALLMTIQALKAEKDLRIEAEKLAELKCIENAELIRTKSHIQSGSMASTMGKLSGANRKINMLEETIVEMEEIHEKTVAVILNDNARSKKEDYLSVQDNSYWLKNFLNFSKAKNALTDEVIEISKANGYIVEHRPEPRPEHAIANVKIYHPDVWNILQKQLESGVYPEKLEKHRYVKIEKPVNIRKIIKAKTNSAEDIFINLNINLTNNEAQK